MNLNDAMRAVRAESLERNGHSGATRARMLETIGRSPRRRLHAAVAAVFASLFGASAFAWYARTPSEPVSQPPTIAVEVASGATAPGGPSSAPGEYTVVRIEAPTGLPASTELGAPAATAPPPPPSAPIESKRAAVPAPIERDAELALYSEAHRLHFVERDMARAVAAWDRYLAAMPEGQLAPEARFNRLVGLVKLERWDEAARAIETVDASSRPADIERLRTVIAAHVR